ncbi:hypothetical protein IFM89_036088, partial [Coptis chinensis]
MESPRKIDGLEFGGRMIIHGEGNHKADGHPEPRFNLLPEGPSRGGHLRLQKVLDLQLARVVIATTHQNKRRVASQTIAPKETATEASSLPDNSQSGMMHFNNDDGVAGQRYNLIWHKNASLSVGKHFEEDTSSRKNGLPNVDNYYDGAREHWNETSVRSRCLGRIPPTQTQKPRLSSRIKA